MRLWGFFILFFPLVERLYHFATPCCTDAPTHVSSTCSTSRVQLRVGEAGSRRAPAPPALTHRPRGQRGGSSGRPLCGTTSAATPSPGWEPPPPQALGRERPRGQRLRPGRRCRTHRPDTASAALTAPTPPPPPAAIAPDGAGPGTPAPPL